jgi:hypothetical protein
MGVVRRLASLRAAHHCSRALVAQAAASTRINQEERASYHGALSIIERASP